MTQGMRIVSFVPIAAALLLLPSRAAAQSGEFPVGHATRLLNVPGIHNPNSPEIRRVNVHLWYPAPDPQNCQSGDGDSQGCPPTVYSSRLNGIPLLPQWDPLSWTIGSTQSFEELPISSAQSSWPVVIFSHGNQGNAIDYAYTLEALASSGYIVAAPDHVNNTQDDVRIDSINAQANSTVIPCFDGLPSPCDVLDRVKAEHSGSDPVVSCLQDNSITTTVSVRESMTDRVRDVSAIIHALPAWFGDRADTLHIGVMGHSRGTVTALAAAGGSTCWGFPADSRVKAVMGLAIGASNITFRVDVQGVTVPALLVAGGADMNTPAMISGDAVNLINNRDKSLVVIQNAVHRHFDSGLCAQTQSAGAIAQADARAILDLQTVTNILISPRSGVAKDFCGFDTFTNPTDIRPLVFSLTGFDVTPTNVPTTGLDTDQVKEQVVGLAVAFFGRVFSGLAQADD